MKNIFPILLIALVGYISCNRTTKTEPTNTQSTEVSSPYNKAVSDMVSTISSGQHNPAPQPEMTSEDSVKFWEIDAYVRWAEKERNTSLNRKDLQLKLFTEQDYFSYTKQDKNIIEAVLVFRDGDESRRHYYYFKDGKYAFYRDLTMRIDSTSTFAKEIIVFFDDDEIFNVGERAIELPPGGNPNNLLGLEFLRPDVDKKAIKQEIETLWEKLFNEIANNELKASNG